MCIGVHGRQSSEESGGITYMYERKDLFEIGKVCKSKQGYLPDDIVARIYECEIRKTRGKFKNKLNHKISDDLRLIEKQNSNDVSEIVLRITATRNDNKIKRGIQKSNLVKIDVSTTNLKSTINYALINARSVKKNLDIIKHAMYESKLDVLSITETWLSANDEYEVKAICPDGFSVMRNDREDRPGGGLLVICNDTLNPRTAESTCEYTSFEHLVVKMPSLTLITLYPIQDCQFLNF